MMTPKRNDSAFQRIEMNGSKRTAAKIYVYESKWLYRLGNKIIIPYGVTEIEFHLFMMCDQATEVEIPSNVTSIGKESDFGPGAFADCSGLREIKLREESPEKSESLLTGTGLDYLKSTCWLN